MFLALVPAYNEEHAIGSVVRSLFGMVDEVVVIDDGSTDRTVEEALAAGATVLVHEINRGQGAALETGHTYARQRDAEYVIHFDADGQFHVDDIAPALTHMKQSRADILFGSRFLDTRSNMPFLKKYLIAPIGRAVNWLFGGLRLSDAHNGFRILNKKALEHIEITHDKMAHATEIPVLTAKHGLSYVEFPVKVTYHEYGQSGLAGFSILKDLLIGKFFQK